jgi:hypothetical protein
MGNPSIGPLGFCRVTDNVVRRREYERTHNVTIWHTEEPVWMWHASWGSEKNYHVIHNEELGGLLDDLDTLGLPRKDQ